MEHLVRFTTAEGRDGLHYAGGLDEALRFVERLRNAEEVSKVGVFRLHEVPIQFRTYYKVEVAGTDGTPGTAQQEPSAAGLTAAEQDPAHGPRGPLPVPGAAGDHDHLAGDGNTRRLFGRG